MENVLGRLGFGSYTAFGKCHIARDIGVKVVTYHNHVKQFGL